MTGSTPTTTKNAQIIEFIRARILDGKYKPGQRIPSETDLGRRFMVTRATVGKALRDLEHEGLILRRRGSGSYVKKNEDQEMLTFGLLVPRLGNGEIFEPICSSIARTIAQRNHRLLWGQFYTDNMEERCADAERLCRSYIDQKVDGVFFAPIELAGKMREANAYIAGMLERAGIPVVLLDSDVVNHPRRSQFDVIGIDNRRVGYVLTSHFLDLGCRKIAFVHHPNSAQTVDARVAGYREALLDRNIPFQRDWVHPGDPCDPAFIDSIVDGEPPEAIICANDHTAAQLIGALLARKIRIPEDIRLAGVDDIKYASLLAVPLTTVHQPCAAIGQSAALAMMERVVNPSLLGRDIHLNFELIVRDSSGSGLGDSTSHPQS